MNEWEVINNSAVEELFSDEIVETDVVESPTQVVAADDDEINSLWDENAVEEEEEDESEEVVEDSETPKPKAEKKKAHEKESINSDLLRAGAEYMAEKLGINIPEEITEWDEDTYAEFLEEAINFKVDERYTSFKSSNGVAEAILDVIENGGDEKALLSIFKEQKEFNNIDTSTPEGKLEKIKRYYKDIDGKSDAWINKKIIGPLSEAEDTTELDAEFEEVSAQYDEFVEAKKTEQVELAKRQKIEKERFIESKKNEFVKVLEAKKVSKKEIAEDLDFVYNDQALKFTATGKTISQFDYAILQAKNKPELLSDLTLFLKDKNAYNTKIITEAKNVKTENSFKAKFNSKKPSTVTEDIKPKVTPKFTLKI